MLRRNVAAVTLSAPSPASTVGSIVLASEASLRLLLPTCQVSNPITYVQSRLTKNGVRYQGCQTPETRQAGKDLSPGFSLRVSVAKFFDSSNAAEGSSFSAAVAGKSTRTRGLTNNTKQPHVKKPGYCQRRRIERPIEGSFSANRAGRGSWQRQGAQDW